MRIPASMDYRNVRGGAMNYLLVVDDSSVDRRVAGRLLEGRNKYHVEYASNGVEALEMLETHLPLALVTDLQMPEMDGMELIETVRRRFATVPVIVMTAHGSEEIAVQALMSGAADYVPKSQLTSELVESVEGVLAITGSDRGQQRLSRALQYQELQYKLDNDLRMIPPLVGSLSQVAKDMGLVCETDRVRLAKALVEALHNAIYHGNLELPAASISGGHQAAVSTADAIANRKKTLPYSERRVYVRAVFSPREARFTIRDEGAGFDISQLPDIKADPSRLCRSGGRGLVLIHVFMDEVSYNPSGNEVTLVKRGAATTQAMTHAGAA